MDTKKILSALAAAGILTAGVFGANVKATDTEYVKPVGIYQQLIQGKTVVPYVLKDKATAITVKDIKAEFPELSLVNGLAVASEEQTLGTGDTFTANDVEYTIVVYGDVNGDGIITTADAAIAQSNFTEIVDLNDVEAEAADVLNDGIITTADAAVIQSYFVEQIDSIITELPPVEDNEGPVLSGVTDGETIYVKQGADYTLPQVTANDEFDGKTEVTMTIADDKEFSTANEDTYTITYSSMDSLSHETSATITVVVDGTAPKVDVTYSTTEVTKDGVTVTINGGELLNEKAIPDGWTLSEDGMSISKVYTIIVNQEEVTVSDKAGNEAKAYITVNNIDSEVENVQISYDKDQSKLTNTDVKATISSDEEIQLIDGWAYVESSDNKKIEKTYNENTIEEVVVKDILDNETTVQVNIQNIDKTRPTAEVSYDVTRPTNGQVNVTIIANEKLQSANGTQTWSLSDDATRATATFSANADDEVTIKDIAGNESIIPVSVTNIDTEKPILNIQYDNEKTTKDPVTVTISAEEKLQAILGWTLSEDAKSMSKTYSENATEDLVVKDLAGNETQATITIANIDLTAPEVTGLTEGQNSYKEVTISFNEGEATYTKDDAEPIGFENNTVFSQEGKYIITVVDSVGNKTIKEFTIDKTAPTFETLEPVTLKKGDVFDTTVYATDTVDGKIEATLEITYNAGKVDTIDTTGANDGEYTLTYKAVDEAGNESTTTRTVTVDATPATVVSIIPSKVDAAKEVTMVIKFSEAMQLPEGWSANEDETELTMKYTENTNETVVFKDKAGNETEVVISINNIDSEVPSVTYNYSTTELTNGNVTVTITSGEELQAIDGWTLAEDKKSMTKEYTENTEAEVTVKDLAGNEVKVNISIDNIDKVFNTISEINKSETNITNQNVTVTIVADEKLKLTNELMQDGWQLGEDETSLVKEFEANTEGEIDVTVSDLAGNTQVVKVNVDNIDKDAPIVEGVENGLSYKSATIKFNEGTATLQKGNEKAQEITTEYEVSDPGTYKLYVVDEAGNAVTILFTIDTTAPELTGVEDQGRYKTVTPEFEEGTAMLSALDGEEQVTSTIQITSGEELELADGKYKIVLSDAAGNEKTVTFTIDTIAPEFSNIEENATYKTITPTVTDNGHQPIILVSLIKDGEEVADYELTNAITEDGNYTLTVKDDVGNEASVKFTIDATAPEVTAEEIEGELTSGGSYKSITPIFDDEDGNVIATLQKDASEPTTFESGTTIGGAEADGSYTLVVTDATGNSNTITFTIDNVAPEITGITDEKLYNSAEVPLTAICADAEKVVLEKDETVVEEYELTDEISEDGEYTLTVTDEAGNEASITFTIDTKVEGAEVYSVSNVINGEAQPTNQDVIVTINADEKMQEVEGWTLSEDKMTLTKTFDANADSQNVTIKDLAGNEATLTFSVTGIDKTAPTVDEVSGVTYSSQDPDQETVTVTITANEAIKLTDELIEAGWGYVEADNEGKTKIEKTYTENTAEAGEAVVIVDMAGNEIAESVVVNVNNITE